MTNADCIRRMSDEQLYEFLSEWECGDIDYSITFCDLCKQGGNELNLDCDGCRKHWLQRDAVDVGGLMYWKRNTTFDTDTPQTEMDKCYKCKWWNYSYGCSNKKGICDFEQADTPQTECDTCRHYKPACELFSEVCKYEPTTQTEAQNSNLTFDTPQTDCGWGKPTTVSHIEDKED